MSDRVLHCSDYDDHPDGVAALGEWLTANGAHPSWVPLDSTITVTGDQLTYESLVHDTEGRVLATEGGTHYARQLRTVPLISPPEAHGL